jgi:CubicO group peptidase (beta-lactamase class C family)
MTMLFRHAVLGLAVLVSGCATSPAGAPRVATSDSAGAARALAQWSTAELAEAISYAASVNSTALLIIQDGHVVAEHRWPLGPNATAFRDSFVHGTSSRGDLLEDVASMQKSFVAILAGVAVDKGRLDPSKPVSTYLGQGWSKASPEQERAITVRNLLEMNSGLDERFEYVAPAGTRFFYNTPVYAVLKPVLEKASGQPLDVITRDWLTAPLGMADTAWRQRPGPIARTSANPTGLVTTAPDIARMGQMVLDRGKAPDGKRVLSEAQLDRMLTRTTTNEAYGELWWLNGGAFAVAPGPAARRAEGPLIPAAPADLVSAQGAQDRKLYVSPSRRLVVVRMGPETGAPDFNQQLWLRLSKAMPANQAALRPG